MDVLGEGKSDEKEERVTIQLLLLCISKIRCFWELGLHTLEVLTNFVEVLPLLGYDLLKTVLEQGLWVGDGGCVVLFFLVHGHLGVFLLLWFGSSEYRLD